jgi:hypothetical protein
MMDGDVSHPSEIRSLTFETEVGFVVPLFFPFPFLLFACLFLCFVPCMFLYRLFFCLLGGPTPRMGKTCR